MLAEAITEHYDSDADFARQAGVSSSAVSRWVSGQTVPSVAMIERIAPWLRVPASTLIAIVHPQLVGVEGDDQQRSHPLARELDRMLDDASPVPIDERQVLETIVDRVVAPYRRHFRRRRTG